MTNTLNSELLKLIMVFPEECPTEFAFCHRWVESSINVWQVLRVYTVV